MSQVVRAWYDEHAEDEWDRLSKDAYHRVEFLVTMHFLETYLPESGLLLDAGGGPGRYTIELAKKGYDVVLLDLSPKCLEIARREIEKAGVGIKIRKIVEGAVSDLSEFDDEMFDAVICLGGPISHILNKKRRRKAMNELKRVAKGGAPIFVSVMSRYGLYRSILKSYQHAFAYLPELLKHGDNRAEWGYTECHFFTPQELKALFNESNIEILDLVGCEGLSSHLQESTETIYSDKKKWKIWKDILLETSNDPSVVGVAEHLLIIGRKGKTKT